MLTRMQRSSANRIAQVLRVVEAQGENVAISRYFNFNYNKFSQNSYSYIQSYDTVL